ncbi:hypothetical protein NMYAN_50092 [Nitrosomonas nitrosa]|uniref:Uncharacterized protein n=1 Tax=Nitrosomonas nitrosa TaxID=52442 RepID=A0A8H8Z188_9PROT|nr:hypothetical protein NMYAN_50092 [Nitrosomonas nitrosa]
MQRGVKAHSSTVDTRRNETKQQNYPTGDKVINTPFDTQAHYPHLPFKFFFAKSEINLSLPTIRKAVRSDLRLSRNP